MTYQQNSNKKTNSDKKKKIQTHKKKYDLSIFLFLKSN